MLQLLLSSYLHLQRNIRKDYCHVFHRWKIRWKIITAHFNSKNILPVWRLSHLFICNISLALWLHLYKSHVVMAKILHNVHRLGDLARGYFRQNGEHPPPLSWAWICYLLWSRDFIVVSSHSARCHICTVSAVLQWKFPCMSPFFQVMWLETRIRRWQYVQL